VTGAGDIHVDDRGLRVARRHRGFAATAVLAVVSVSCSGSGQPPASPVAVPSTAPVAPSTTAPPTAPAITTDGSDPVATTDASGELDADVVIDAAAIGRPIDRRVLGTNVPAWLGRERLTDPAFQDRTIASGVTVLRMPGGSWSNAYDWAACEQRDADRCLWTWGARPTDFIEFMQATDLAGMWTVSINQTAQSAAAAVAFFNGSVDDRTVIGIDRDGVDWGTVGEWARLRADHGNADPVPILLWEVGNEVYGGKPGAGGDECADFGWEDVWTCDGAAYTTGDADHDGYLQIREAMISVDPAIEVGAVGVSQLDAWSGWGEEVVAEAGDDLDFYVVHEYGFGGSPDVDEAVGQPADSWPKIVDRLRREIAPTVPIAVTEYNLVSFEAGDDELSMTQSLNALFIADTIGQMIVSGVQIANQWNLANGTTSSGTDYGLVDADDYSPFPQYHAMAMWGSTGDTLLDVEIARERVDLAERVRVYPTRRADGSLAIVLLNLDDDPIEFDLALTGLETSGGAPSATLAVTSSPDPEGPELTIDDPVAVAGIDDGRATLVLPPWSMNLMEVTPSA
jgi:hypothetical protein